MRDLRRWVFIPRFGDRPSPREEGGPFGRHTNSDPETSLETGDTPRGENKHGWVGTGNPLPFRKTSLYPLPPPSLSLPSLTPLVSLPPRPSGAVGWSSDTVPASDEERPVTTRLDGQRIVDGPV